MIFVILQRLFMTAHDTLDLFSSALRRERMVDWQAPGPAAKAAMGLSGMEAMQAIRDGRLPPPPLAKLIGFRVTSSSRDGS
jgi:hypothetical protein